MNGYQLAKSGAMVVLNPPDRPARLVRLFFWPPDPATGRAKVTDDRGIWTVSPDDLYTCAHPPRRIRDIDALPSVPTEGAHP